MVLVISNQAMLCTHVYQRAVKLGVGLTPKGFDSKEGIACWIGVGIQMGK